METGHYIQKCNLGNDDKWESTEQGTVKKQDLNIFHTNGNDVPQFYGTQYENCTLHSHMHLAQLHWKEET